MQFSSGVTRSQVYNEILRNSQSNSNDGLTVYLNKGGQSNFSRRRGFKFVIYQLLPREMWT